MKIEKIIAFILIICFASFNNAFAAPSLNVDFSKIDNEKLKPASSLYNNKDYLGAFTIFNNECAENNSDACVFLGELHYIGRGTKPNPIEAKKYYKKSCELNNKMGCLLYADILRDPNDSSKNKDEIIISLKKSCDLGETYACLYLGDKFYNTRPMEFFFEYSKLIDLEPTNYCNQSNVKQCKLEINSLSIFNHVAEKAKKKYEVFCKKGNLYDCHHLAIIEFQYGDEYKAAQIFDKTCNAGLDKSCYEMAIHEQMMRNIYNNDEVLVKEREKIISNLCYNVNRDYCLLFSSVVSRGVNYYRFKQDLQLIPQLTIYACDNGDKNACSFAALYMMSHINDYEIKPSVEQTTKLFKKACDLNYAAECARYGIALFNGIGIPENKEEAIKYFKYACDEKVSDGCFGLALGQIEYDKPTANKLLYIACGSDYIACYYLAETNKIIDIKKYAETLGSACYGSINSDPCVKFHDVLLKNKEIIDKPDFRWNLSGFYSKDNYNSELSNSLIRAENNKNTFGYRLLIDKLAIPVENKQKNPATL